MNNSWKFILATVVIFGAGVVVGGLLIYHVHPSHPKNALHPQVAVATTNPPPAESVDLLKDLLKTRPPELSSQHLVQRLDDLLQLTPPQREAIHKIIAEGQEQNHGLWTNCSAQSRQVLQEVKQHIREQLNPEQQKQFETLLKQAHSQAHRAPGPGTNTVPAPATNAPDGRSP